MRIRDLRHKHWNAGKPIQCRYYLLHCDSVEEWVTNECTGTAFSEYSVFSDVCCWISPWGTNSMAYGTRKFNTSGFFFQMSLAWISPFQLWVHGCCFRRNLFLYMVSSGLVSRGLRLWVSDISPASVAGIFRNDCFNWCFWSNLRPQPTSP